MWRWNVVQDYRRVFTKSGRYQRWSERDRLRMLAKAVNRMKPRVLYNEEEIAATREEEWGLQLKENILSLNLWQRRRLKNNIVLTQSLEVEQPPIESQSASINAESQNEEVFIDEIPSDMEVHTESINAGGNLLTQTPSDLQSQKQPGKSQQQLPSQYEIHTESMDFSNLNNNNELINNSSDEINLMLDASSDIEYLGEGDSEDSIDTVLEKDIAEKSHSEEVAPEIENMYGVNTLSMTIDSQMTTQSQYLPVQQSQDIIPHDYDNFKNIIPLTSTQSQSNDLEEIIVYEEIMP